jgi:preprotein translocase subunit YajC
LRRGPAPAGRRAPPDVARAQSSEDLDVPIDLLITPAYAQSAPAFPFGGDLMAFLPMVAIFVVFYFLLIRPQQKKAKEAKAMLGALQKGDEVVTAGGILGRISKLGDQYVTVDIASGTEITVQRGAISQLLPKGTIKAL